MRVRLAVGTADSGGTNKFGELFLRPGTTRQRVFRVASLPVGPADLHQGHPGRGLARRRPDQPVAQPRLDARASTPTSSTR